MTLPTVSAELQFTGTIYIWRRLTDCAFCHRKHWHSGGYGKDDPRLHLGKRVAKCVKDGGEYVLVDANPAETARVIERARARAAA